MVWYLDDFPAGNLGPREKERELAIGNVGLSTCPVHKGERENKERGRPFQISRWQL